MDNRSQTQASLAGSLPGESGRGFYSPQLDGLRFWAAFLVLICHAPKLPWPLFAKVQLYGWVGVDLFLCISAYLITRLILLEQERTGRFSLKSFYIRRALRIWPLYLGYVTLIGGIAVVRGKLDAGAVLGWWLSHLTFTNNLFTAIHGWTPISCTMHLWTISLEEQAYLVLPLLLIAHIATKPSTRSIIWLCVGSLVLLNFARLAFFLAGVGFPSVYVLPLRGDAFILGSLAAILFSRGWLKPGPWMVPAGAAAMCSVALFPPLEVMSSYHLIGYTVTALGAAGIVFGSQSAWFDRGLLASAPLRFLGKISYGIYIFHAGAIFAMWKIHRWVPLSNLSLLLGAILLTLIIASASYHLFERPFLKLKQRFQHVESRPI
jgi:peptidoglycan/LPS O-acetylase OafA/YrhL